MISKRQCAVTMDEISFCPAFEPINLRIKVIRMKMTHKKYRGFDETSQRSSNFPSGSM